MFSHRISVKFYCEFVFYSWIESCGLMLIVPVTVWSVFWMESVVRLRVDPVKQLED